MQVRPALLHVFSLIYCSTLIKIVLLFSRFYDSNFGRGVGRGVFRNNSDGDVRTLFLGGGGVKHVPGVLLRIRDRVVTHVSPNPDLNSD